LALELAHKNKIIHRDIKPENIVCVGDRIVLADFGIVKAIAKENILHTNYSFDKTKRLGTPGFMAPEQIQGKVLDEGVDIFALSAVLYNLATDHLPFDGDTIEQILTQVKSIRCVIRVISIKICQLNL